jgi:hypothetical protein
MHSDERASHDAFKEDCRACSGVKSMLKDAFRRTRAQDQSSGSHAAPQEDKAHASAEPGGKIPAAIPCPPNSEQIGRSTWTFLHTMAAYYPSEPSSSQQSLMRSLLDGLAEFYPCGHCRAHLREQIKESPPVVSSASELSLWLCRIHNEVNEMLGKPLFDCSRVFERYKDGPKESSACD